MAREGAFCPENSAPAWSLFAGEDHPLIKPISSLHMGWHPLRSNLPDSSTFRPVSPQDAPPEPQALLAEDVRALQLGWSQEEAAAPSVEPALPAGSATYAAVARLAPPQQEANSNKYPLSLPLPQPDTDLNQPPPTAGVRTAGGGRSRSSPVSFYLPPSADTAGGPLVADDAGGLDQSAPAEDGAGTSSPPGKPPVPDFIGTVDNMKEILKMPYTKDSVTMAVYRVGRTLVMDNMGQPKHGAAQGAIPLSPNPFSALAQHEQEEEEGE